jgi:hypothetical protein
MMAMKERQRAEHQHDRAGDQRHDRNVLRHHVRGDHRRHDRHHEGAGRGEQVELRIDDEEHDQRTEFGGELEQRMRLSLVHYQTFVAVITRESG